MKNPISENIVFFYVLCLLYLVSINYTIINLAFLWFPYFTVYLLNGFFKFSYV